MQSPLLQDLKKEDLKKKIDRKSHRQTEAGIGHSTPAHRGAHVQNRIRRRQARRGKIGPGPGADRDDKQLWLQEALVWRQADVKAVSD